MTSSRAIYRSRQVFHALFPRIPSVDLEYALQLMSGPEVWLFHSMPRRDQRHALAVMSRLRETTDHRDLLLAGLLHDCGKGDVPIWLRILHVIAPRFGRVVGQENATGWRNAAYRLNRHVELSARLAEEAGCSAVTVRLVAGKPLPEEAPLAALLFAADDAS